MGEARAALLFLLALGADTASVLSFTVSEMYGAERVSARQEAARRGGRKRKEKHFVFRRGAFLTPSAAAR